VRLALLSHPTAQQPSAVWDVANATELRHLMAQAPATGYCLAVEVHDPITRIAEWFCVPSRNPDGSLRLASYMTIRGGIASAVDCRAVWGVATATADYYRELNSQLRSVCAWVARP
jgi:hypothetical protein